MSFSSFSSNISSSPHLFLLKFSIVSSAMNESMNESIHTSIKEKINIKIKILPAMNESIYKNE